MNDNPVVKSAARILDLLELFSSSHEPIGVSALARRLSFPKSSLHMLLLTLEQRGFVVSDDARRFQLHPSFSPDARAWIGGSRGRLVQLARGPMRALVDRTKETCLLSVMRPDWRTEYIAKVVCSQELRLDAAIGSTREANAGSSGLVLLAFAPEKDLERFLATQTLKRYTTRTICDPRRLRRELAGVRAHGYAIAEGTNYSHASGVSAPIRNAHGNVIAAISIGAPTVRFTAIREVAVAGVLKAADALTKGVSSARMPEIALVDD